MKTNALKKFREKIAGNKPVYGLWITLESPSITEMAVALGMDWIVIDAEHGHLDWKAIVEHVRATVRSDTVALVRVAESNAGLIKRALDVGADGVVVPWIESPAQLDQVMQFAWYPPEGVRGIGAERATAWGQCLAQHTAEANENILVIPLIETVQAGKCIEQLCACKGTELFFLGPADYSSTAGFRGQWEGPGVGAELLRILEVIRRLQKHCGVLATSNEDLVQRCQQGFRMLGIGADTGLLLRSLHAALGAVGRDRSIQPSFTPSPDTLPITPLARVPESLRPDRTEVMSSTRPIPPVFLAADVRFDCHVGPHNQARDLTTGFVRFGPGTTLPTHTHNCSEAITVLSGELTVTVEDREYALGPLDNIVIPRGVVHASRNNSGVSPANVHVAFASSEVARDLADAPTQVRRMPADAAGVPGREHVTRINTAPRYAAGPGTGFVDYFNSDLVPGIEMSGGYARFLPGGRLPAHVHYFDESISIVEGSATCIVEGRRYQMAHQATALQPRGRVHYFINESQEAMAMIWVYAGPLPERIMVAESCATTEGSPWHSTEAGS
jgi:2-keto-3-deoxy-L-rhamnonate aldolase RhmA/quercetin dioxygenase-like cupin family protein